MFNNYSLKKIMTVLPVSVLLAVSSSQALSASSAHEVNITKKTAYVDIKYQGQSVRIERNQNQENVLTGGYAKTSRKCPPFCINPIAINDQVKTVGELEILHFLEDEYKSGEGVLIDARTPSWHSKGTIPGSVNIPFTIFGESHNNPELKSAMTQLGVTKTSSGWNFKKAKKLMLWCNGSWCGQSPRAIRNLVDLGYPQNKLHWYRGGMQAWRVLGLTVTIPGADLID